MAQGASFYVPPYLLPLSTTGLEVGFPELRCPLAPASNSKNPSSGGSGGCRWPLCSLSAKRQKRDDDHRQQNRGPVQNLDPHVVIVAKQSEVRLRDQQHRIDGDTEDDEVRDNVQAFEIDQAARLHLAAQRILRAKDDKEECRADENDRA